MLEAEIIEKEIVVLQQEPIITYDLVQAKGKEVQEQIASLNIETIEANNDNLQLLKKTRSSLNKEFKELEDKRKMIKDLVMKPYNDFEVSYKEHIQKHFKDADLLLKDKVTEVDDAILKNKINGIEGYFEQVNTFDFISFYDVGLDIKKSVTDKKLKEEIEEYIIQVQSDLSTIDTLSNKDRVLVKYQIVKDLNRAISDVNIELQREEQIQKQREQEQATIRRSPIVETVEEPVVPVEDDKIYLASFTVKVTKQQLRELKNYMNEKGIRYE